MSAFNTVVQPAEELCPRCGSLTQRRVQFKYGDTWQYEYAVGDRISWGGNDVGVPATLVKVLSYQEDCPVCGYDFGGVFHVIVGNGIIEDVVPGTTRPYVEADHESYIIIVP
jgi:hypothetical protein